MLLCSKVSERLYENKLPNIQAGELQKDCDMSSYCKANKRRSKLTFSMVARLRVLQIEVSSFFLCNEVCHTRSTRDRLADDIPVDGKRKLAAR